MNFMKISQESIGILNNYFEFVSPYMDMYLENIIVLNLPNVIDI